MRIDMLPMGQEPILAGSLSGKGAFASLIGNISLEPFVPEPLFLDFVNVEIATASFLRESVFSLKSYLRAAGSKFYPVAANVNDLVYDELLMVAIAKNDAIISCRLAPDGKVTLVDLVGQLDEKQQFTFDLVNKLNQADANLLNQRYGDGEKTTAWNNRLAGLVSRGLIREFSKGRAKYYRPVLEGVE